MPTTADGQTVYAPPEEAVEYVQTDANQFSLSTTTDSDSDGVSDWQEFIETIQARMKSRIDEYVGRDFEDHQGATVTLDGGATPSRFLNLPTPVRNVSEVRVQDEPLSGGGYGGGSYGVLNTDQYEWRENGHLIRLDDSGSRGQWPAGYDNIEVDLDWGYPSPPEDVVEAELKLTAHTIVGLAQMREGMIVQQDDIDVQVALPEAMTTEVKNILRHHREGGRTAGVI